MSRDVPEWIEYDHNKPVPDRVKDRVVLRADRRCKNCGVRVSSGGEVDHVPAVILLPPDTPQRESCLQFLCKPCHKAKTGEDVAAKAASYKKRKRHGPLKLEQSAWSKKYHAMKKWKATLK